MDYVLAYENDSKLKNEEKQRKRETFEKNLEKAGLILEIDKTQKIHFVKIHAPHDTLCQYSEILKLRFPISEKYVRFYII